MSGECPVNVKSQSELDIGGRETCQIPFINNPFDEVLGAAQLIKLEVHFIV